MNRWIDAEKFQPPAMRDVLVTIIGDGIGRVVDLAYLGHDHCWRYTGGPEGIHLQVSHWQHLPPPAEARP